MRTSKLDAVVENWFPRFLANGLDYFDVRRMLDAIATWDDWAPVWTEAAERYADLGHAALATGHRVTAAEHLRRAALTMQFAQFVLTDQPDLRKVLQGRQADLYAACAPLLDPPAGRVEIGEGAEIVLGYLRTPPASPSSVLPGLVVLLPGLESTKEQFSTYEPYFLRRGVATLSVEGPGQGEHAAPFRSTAYGRAMSAVATHLLSLEGVDTNRVVVLGTSFGGHLALRFADRFPNLRGVVDIAGPYDLDDFDGLQPVTQESLRDFVGADGLDEAKRLLSDVSLDGVLEKIRVPVLVVHGERDAIIPVSHAHRIVRGLGELAEARHDSAGNHSCNNLATVVRPFVADWVADRLLEAS